MGRNNYYIHCYRCLKSYVALPVDHEVMIITSKADSNTRFQREWTHKTDDQFIFKLSFQTYHSLVSSVTQVFVSVHPKLWGAFVASSTWLPLRFLPTWSYVRHVMSYQSLYCPPPCMIITGKMSRPQISSCSRTHAYTCEVHKHALAPCDLPLACKAFINT